MYYYTIHAAFERSREPVSEKTDSRTPAERRPSSREEEEKTTNAVGFCNRRVDRKCYLVRAGGGRAEFAMVSRDLLDCGKVMKPCLEKAGLNIESFVFEETTLMRFYHMLERSARNGYIEDEDVEIEGLDLGVLLHSRGPLQYDENVIDTADSEKSDLLETAVDSRMSETLVPEIERIYESGKKGKTACHPVHYLLAVNDTDTRRETHRLLLRALYANNRLQSRRYTYVNAGPGLVTFDSEYDALYSSCSGGTVIVRMNIQPFDVEDDMATADVVEIIRVICATMQRHRHDVLTILCLPRVCDAIKRSIYEELNAVAFVEVCENHSDYEHACKFLARQCKLHSVRPDKRLYGMLDREARYYPEELLSAFSEWFDRKVRTSLYPQYGDVPVCLKKNTDKGPKGTAAAELDKMVGLTKAKEVIRKALNAYKMRRLYEERGIPQNKPSLHMVFTGNPGTAKTTTARLFARIMRENGLLSRGHLVEVGRGDLVGKFVGWTAKTVREKFKEAMGGVLFIDEAYSLVDDRHGSFGDEAINTIVQEMENRRDDLVVIFAGYPKEMEKFLQNNPGLRSRIAFHVPFDDYDAGELCEIARLIGKQQGVTFTDGAMEKMHRAFDAVRSRVDFGNGRYVRNLVELARMNQADRLVRLDPDRVTRQMLTTVEDTDIEFPEEDESCESVNRIGFVG